MTISQKTFHPGIPCACSYFFISQIQSSNIQGPGYHRSSAFRNVPSKEQLETEFISPIGKTKPVDNSSLMYDDFLESTSIETNQETGSQKHKILAEKLEQEMSEEIMAIKELKESLKSLTSPVRDIRSKRMKPPLPPVVREPKERQEKLKTMDTSQSPSAKNVVRRLQSAPILSKEYKKQGASVQRRLFQGHSEEAHPNRRMGTVGEQQSVDGVCLEVLPDGRNVYYPNSKSLNNLTIDTLGPRSDIYTNEAQRRYGPGSYKVKSVKSGQSFTKTCSAPNSPLTRPFHDKARLPASRGILNHTAPCADGQSGNFHDYTGPAEKYPSGHFHSQRYSRNYAKAAQMAESYINWKNSTFPQEYIQKDHSGNFPKASDTNAAWMENPCVYGQRSIQGENQFHPGTNFPDIEPPMKTETMPVTASPQGSYCPSCRSTPGKNRSQQGNKPSSPMTRRHDGIFHGSLQPADGIFCDPPQPQRAVSSLEFPPIKGVTENPTESVPSTQAILNLLDKVVDVTASVAGGALTPERARLNVASVVAQSQALNLEQRQSHTAAVAPLQGQAQSLAQHEPYSSAQSGPTYAMPQSKAFVQTQGQAQIQCQQPTLPQGQNFVPASMQSGLTQTQYQPPIMIQSQNVAPTGAQMQSLVSSVAQTPAQNVVSCPSQMGTFPVTSVAQVHDVALQMQNPAPHAAQVQHPATAEASAVPAAVSATSSENWTSSSEIEITCAKYDVPDPSVQQSCENINPQNGQFVEAGHMPVRNQTLAGVSAGAPMTSQTPSNVCLCQSVSNSTCETSKTHSDTTNTGWSSTSADTSRSALNKVPENAAPSRRESENWSELRLRLQDLDFGTNIENTMSCPELQVWKQKPTIVLPQPKKTFSKKGRKAKSMKSPSKTKLKRCEKTIRLDVISEESQDTARSNRSDPYTKPDTVSRRASLCHIEERSSNLPKIPSTETDKRETRQNLEDITQANEVPPQEINRSQLEHWLHNQMQQQQPGNASGGNQELSGVFRCWGADNEEILVQIARPGTNRLASNDQQSKIICADRQTDAAYIQQHGENSQVLHPDSQAYGANNQLYGENSQVHAVNNPQVNQQYCTNSHQYIANNQSLARVNSHENAPQMTENMLDYRHSDADYASSNIVQRKCSDSSYRRSSDNTYRSASSTVCSTSSTLYSSAASQESASVSHQYDTDYSASSQQCATDSHQNAAASQQYHASSVINSQVTNNCETFANSQQYSGDVFQNAAEGAGDLTSVLSKPYANSQQHHVQQYSTNGQQYSANSQQYSANSQQFSDNYGKENSQENISKQQYDGNRQQNFENVQCQRNGPQLSHQESTAQCPNDSQVSFSHGQQQLYLQNNLNTSSLPNQTTQQYNNVYNRDTPNVGNEADRTVKRTNSRLYQDQLETQQVGFTNNQEFNVHNPQCNPKSGENTNQVPDPTNAHSYQAQFEGGDQLHGMLDDSIRRKEAEQEHLDRLCELEARLSPPITTEGEHREEFDIKDEVDQSSGGMFNDEVALVLQIA